MKKAYLSTLAAAAAGIGLWQCANPGTPTGGPRDIEPPVLVRSTPAPNAVGFSGSKVVLEFNENIQLKDAMTKFVVSPPMITAPSVNAHANTVTVEFKSDLEPGTTYTLDFADCISDLNEGNVLSNYTFTFSTGESTDSMMISGFMYGAATLKPMQGMYALLYKCLDDTAFTRSVPMRIAKTDASGRFRIKNIPADAEYRVYGLDDSNRNFIFDQPGEQIAWHVQPVRPTFEYRTLTDTLVPGTPASALGDRTLPADSLLADTAIVTRDTLFYLPDSLNLFVFAEDVYTQFIASDERPDHNTLRIIFNKPMKSRPRFGFPGVDSIERRHIAQFSAHNDTCLIWLTDSVLYKPDSVCLSVSYPVLDSLGQMTDRTDTLTLWHFNLKQKEKKRRRKDAPEPAPSLKLTIPQSIEIYSDLPIVLPAPAARFDTAGVRLSIKSDTLFVPVACRFAHDTVSICRYTLRHKWEPGAEYRLEIDSAAIVDCYGLAVNPTKVTVKPKALDSYSTLYVSVANAPANALLQIVSGKDAVVRQAYIPANGKVGFRYLKPADYMLRVVRDDNRNGRWDTGNFEQGVQPEKVSYYMEKVSTRANWEILVEFDDAAFSPTAFAEKFLIKKKTTRKTSSDRR